MLAGRPGEDGPLFSLLAQIESAVGGFTRRAEHYARTQA
jgi:hypothetical protein